MLVTGGAGCIASGIVKKLISHGYQVVIIDNLSRGKERNIFPGVTFYEVDIRSSNVEKIFGAEKPDYVIHHAAQVDIEASILDPFHDAQVNILGTINLLENCKKTGVKKFIYASSAAVFGNAQGKVNETLYCKPLSFYGISKFTPEIYLRLYHDYFNLKYTILRYSNVYGWSSNGVDNKGVIPVFIDKLYNYTPPIVYGNGDQTRDFIYVEDVAEANLSALRNGDNEVFNISSNQPISINQLLSLLNNLLNTDIKPIYQEKRQSDVQHSSLDNRKAIEKLKWIPKYTIIEGLEKTVNRYLEERFFELDYLCN